MIPLSFLFLYIVLSSVRYIRAQERPFVSVEEFSPIPSYRTNVCDRQIQLYEEEIELKDALRGLELSVAITNYKSHYENSFFTLVNGKIKENDPGLYVVLLDELARRAGFTWRNRFAAIKPLDFRIHGNKTWADLLYWEVEHFDIAADYWARSPDRMAQGVSFPHGWYDTSMILVTSENDTGSINLWKFLTPFEINVWIMILVGIVFTGMMYFILERLDSGTDALQLDEKPITTIFLAAITFTGHYELSPYTNAARILGFSWTFWTLIMASAYTANMASFLMQRKSLAASLNTIGDAVRLSVPVCVLRGAVIDDILSKKYPELILVRKASELELFEALNYPWYGGKGGCGAVLTSLGNFEISQRQKSVNSDCSLNSMKRIVLDMPAGFATAIDSGILCTSLISYTMDFHLQEMERDGFIEKAWKGNIEKISTITCDESVKAVTGNTSLGIQDMGGIFITHATAILLALSIAAFQFFLKKRLLSKEVTQSLRPSIQNSTTANQVILQKLNSVKESPYEDRDNDDAKCMDPTTDQMSSSHLIMESDTDNDIQNVERFY
jgi:Ligand-gated ion channel